MSIYKKNHKYLQLGQQRLDLIQVGYLRLPPCQLCFDRLAAPLDLLYAATTQHSF